MDQPNPQPISLDRKKESGNDLVFSYLTLRNLIGICGILLPVVLVLTTCRSVGDKMIKPSISDYYYSSDGDVLVVMLSVLGVFLFTYNGYKWTEKALTTLAAICGIGVAFSPMSIKDAYSLSIHLAKPKVPEIFGIERHFIFAMLFFVSLAIISLIYFSKTDKTSLRLANGKRTQKAKRNIVYKICGWTMLSCVGIMGLYFIIKPDLNDFPIVFVFETIAIWAFGISWITKGETLWPDGEHYIKKAYREIKNAI